MVTEPDDAAETAAQEADKQGLPRHVEDPMTIAEVVQLLADLEAGRGRQPRRRDAQTET